MNNTVIETVGLCRDFKVRLKSEGLAASVKNFFNPVYKTVSAVKSLDIAIQKGEIIGFLGPNGAGKTTTLKMLSGLLLPTCGEIKVLNHVPFSREKQFLQNISLVMGQKQNLWWDLPPLETFAIHKSIYQIEAKAFKERVDELIAMLEIEDCLETQTRRLSLGQRMRCELAVSLLHQPEVLFLDEPTIGLDVLMQKKIRSFLLDYHRRFNTTILLTSHYMDDVAALAQRVIVIDLGQTYEINGFRYQPRTDGGINGTILEYEFCVSDDPEVLGTPVASGVFDRTMRLKEVTFKPAKGRYVCLRSISEINGKPFASVAELTLLGK